MSGTDTIEIIPSNAVVGVNNKSWWGPRIWRILHSLAEINDRMDTGPAWRQALSLTAEVLPCAMCREHFRTHVRRMTFPIGVSNYGILRRTLWTIHTATVTGKEPFPEERLATDYGGAREEIVTRVTHLLSEVVTAFQMYGVLDRLHVANLAPWNRAVRQLIALLQYPQPPVQPQQSRAQQPIVRRRIVRR